MAWHLARWELEGVGGPVVGVDDVLAAELIERARLGEPLDAPATSAALCATDEAARTRALGAPHCDPADIELAATVDAFDFAMEVERTDRGLRLTARADA